MRWRTRDDVRRARRLHALLEATTGCDDLPWLGDDGDEPAALARRNGSLGRLWIWFLNEFAHTGRTWTAYCRLLPR